MHTYVHAQSILARQCCHGSTHVRVPMHGDAPIPSRCSWNAGVSMAAPRGRMRPERAGQLYVMIHSAGAPHQLKPSTSKAQRCTACCATAASRYAPCFGVCQLSASLPSGSLPLPPLSVDLPIASSS
eukprot:103597-Chlamydomonas_euryale.AAC.8